MSLDKDERYTLPSTVAAIKKLAGVEAFDLDAAACAESHHALAYFTKEANGLERPWFGAVFVNPPFSELEAWVSKAMFEMDSGRCSSVAMVLPENRREQPWWQELVEPFRDFASPANPWTLRSHTLPGRVRFGSPGDPAGTKAGSPNFGTCVLVWRNS